MKEKTVVEALECMTHHLMTGMDEIVDVLGHIYKALAELNQQLDDEEKI